MCRRLCSSSDWLSVSTWEADKPAWTPTVQSVQYHDELAKSQFNAELRLLGEFVLFDHCVDQLWKQLVVISYHHLVSLVFGRILTLN